MTVIVFEEAHIYAAIHYAAKKNNYTVDRRGMNLRGLAEKIDDKIMGDLAEIGVCLFLRNNGLVALTYDQIRTDDFSQPDPGWDVFVGTNRDEIYKWVGGISSGESDPKIPPYEFGWTMSVKSSRLPPNDIDYDRAISIRDFKIFNNHKFNIRLDLTADIEVQVYFPYLRTQLDKSIVLSSHQVEACRLNRADCIPINKQLNILERYQDCFLARWNHKENIIQYSESLPIENRTWSSFGKSMWIAPLKNGRYLTELVDEVGESYQ